MKSAPDVNLQARGLSRHTCVTIAAVTLAVFLYSRQGTGESEAPGGEDSSLPYWLISPILWGVIRIVQLGVFLLLTLLVILVVRQRSIIYVPTPPGMQRSPSCNPYMMQSPAPWNMPYEDVYIVAEDGVRIHAWFIYQPLATCETEVPYTFVYFHGNAGNIGHRLQNIQDMHAKLGVNVLIIDYRGYGNSENGGGPCEQGFLMDAIGAYRWLVQRIQNPPQPSVTRMRSDRILLFGRSIGGAVGIQLAAHLLREHRRGGPLPVPAGIVLENTFVSLRDMAVCVFPFLSILRPILRSPLLFDEWKSADSLKFFAENHDQWCCCLLSGKQDEIVPPIQMVHLHNILTAHRPRVLKFFRFARGGHNDTPQRAGAEYWESFQKFMALI